MESDAMPDDDATAEIRMLETRPVYRNRWMTVREDLVERQDGSQGIYGVVEKPDFAVIIPLDRDGCVHLVEQYRYPVKARYWEFPQGSWEERPDADPAELARGELLEETGLLADDISHIGHLFECYGYCNQGYNVFLARGLRPGSAKLDPEEAGLITRRFGIDAFVEMILSGRIKDSATVAAFGLLQLKGLVPPGRGS